jgi:hypothetical protein
MRRLVGARGFEPPTSRSQQYPLTTTSRTAHTQYQVQQQLNSFGPPCVTLLVTSVLYASRLCFGTICGTIPFKSQDVEERRMSKNGVCASTACLYYVALSYQESCNRGVPLARKRAACVHVRPECRGQNPHDLSRSFCRAKHTYRCESDKLITTLQTQTDVHT